MHGLRITGYVRSVQQVPIPSMATSWRGFASPPASAKARSMHHDGPTVGSASTGQISPLDAGLLTRHHTGDS